MLKLSDVVAHLCARGVLNGSHLVEHEVRAFDMSRRNSNFRVTCGANNSLFVKQGEERDGFSGVRREADVYRLLQAPPKQRDDQRFRHMPQLVDYDADLDVLVTSFIEGGMDLRRLGTSDSSMFAQAAGLLGKALGQLHSAMPLPEARAVLGWGEPGVLAAQRPGLALLRDFSAASIDLMRLMQQDDDLMRSLDWLAEGWTEDAVLHHDLRLDNVLYRSAAREIVIVDWESAAVGEAAWDVGSAVGDYLGLWLMSIPGSSSMNPDQCMHLARRPLPTIQPAIGALFDSYCADRGLRGSAQDTFAVRVASFAGLKLLQSALEQVQAAPRWTIAALCHLQVAANMLARPADGSSILLGLGRAAA